MHDRDTNDHHIDPVKGSARRADGSPADLLNPAHYPVTAVCVTCGRPVRADRFWFSDWYHLQAADSEPAGKVLSLLPYRAARERERALEEAIAAAEAAGYGRERDTEHARYLPPRLRLVVR